jgi:selenocysteine lyase/cysteine desulfurase
VKLDRREFIASAAAGAEGGAQIRAGAAVFNNEEDVERFFDAAEELRGL